MGMSVTYKIASTYIQDEKGLIFITGNEKQEEKLRCESFQQTHASAPSEHALLRKISFCIR